VCALFGMVQCHAPLSSVVNKNNKNINTDPPASFSVCIGPRFHPILLEHLVADSGGLLQDPSH
jgi:hypothetical protein